MGYQRTVEYSRNHLTCIWPVFNFCMEAATCVLSISSTISIILRRRGIVKWLIIQVCIKSSLGHLSCLAALPPSPGCASLYFTVMNFLLAMLRLDLCDTCNLKAVRLSLLTQPDDLGSSYCTEKGRGVRRLDKADWWQKIRVSLLLKELCMCMTCILYKLVQKFITMYCILYFLKQK